jgi:CubicO group peptidase (beta-lactamase class C family)
MTLTGRFVTASVAKAFTAVAIAQLADSGYLLLDVPIARYLPASVFDSKRADRITTSQLLTHTAGLADVVGSSAFRRAPASLVTFDQVLALVRSDTTSTASEAFRYGDGDYVLLGALVRQISGKSFAGFAADHVFASAGMTGSTYEVKPRPDDVVHGYTTRDLSGPSYRRLGSAAGDSEPPLHVNDAILPGVGVPGSVAFTTAPDLMRFADALLAHRILSAKALTELWTGHVATGQGARNPANSEYGYGFFVGHVGPHRIVNHGGTGPGIDNAFDIYPDLRIVVVILANMDPPAAQDLRQVVRDGLAGLGAKSR